MQSVPPTSTTQQYANVHGSVLGINHLIPIILFIKRQRKRDEMTVKKEESLSTHGAHVHAKGFLLWCLTVSNICLNPASQAYNMTGVHYMAVWHACVIRSYLHINVNIHM